MRKQWVKRYISWGWHTNSWVVSVYMRAEPAKVKCKHCGYEWYTRSTKKYIACPNCYYKIRNPYYREERRANSE